MEEYQREYHLTEDRLLEMVSESELRPSEHEDAHLENCPQCFGQLVELVKHNELASRVTNHTVDPHITPAYLNELADKKRELSDAEATHIWDCEECCSLLAEFLKRYISTG
jgi:hypothetical protein